MAWTEEQVQRYLRKKRKHVVRLLEEQESKCMYCSKLMWHHLMGQKGSKQDLATIEHRKCKKHGGTESWRNKGMSCYACNSLKGHLSEEEYVSELSQFNNDVTLLKKHRKRLRDKKLASSVLNPRKLNMLMAIVALLNHYERNTL